MTKTQEIARLRAAENACRASAKLLLAIEKHGITTDEPEGADKLGELIDRAASALESWGMVKRGDG